METAIIEQTEQKALSIPDQAKALTVASNEDYTQGETLLSSCKQLETEIHAAFDPIVEKAHLAHKEAVAQRAKYLNPIEEGRKILKQKMIAFQQEQERIRREEQARLEAEAQKRAEDEALALASQAEAEGNTEMAEAIISEPVQAAPVVLPKMAPKASRLSAGKTLWYAEVTDIKALCKAIADGKASINLIEPNMTALNNMARAMKSTMNIPGVQAKSKIV